MKKYTGQIRLAPKHDSRAVSVNGYRVELPYFPFLAPFVHLTLDSVTDGWPQWSTSDWTCSDLHTGVCLGGGKTRQDAIDDVSAHCNKAGLARTKDLFDAMMVKHDNQSLLGDQS